MRARVHQYVSGRGLTLLEMMIALTILASITAGIGIFWGQARAWEADNAEHRGLLRTERALRLVREQWGQRRALGVEGEGDAGGSGVMVTLGGVTFTSARSVLFPGWGLVRVRYAIERAQDGAYELVCEESRIMDVSAPYDPGTSAIDPRLRPIGGREVLIGDLDGLRLERWGTETGEVRTALTPVATGEDEAGEGEGLFDEEGSSRDEAEAWRAYDREIEFPVRAVRFVGERGEEVFSCVLVVEPSR